MEANRLLWAVRSKLLLTKKIKTMELRVFNNHVGSFNLLNSSQKTFEFSMALVDDKRNIIEVGGIKAMISYSGDPEDKYMFEQPTENLHDVFTKCFEYADVVWSTRDYKGQCLLFAKLYMENYEAMDKEAVAKHKEETQKRIDKLQKELEWNTVLPDLTESINSAIDAKIAKVKKSVSFKEKELSELKEDSESYAKAKKYLDDYNAEIEKYKQYYVV